LGKVENFEVENKNEPLVQKWQKLEKWSKIGEN